MKTKVWLAELVGTALLVFVGGGAAAAGAGLVGVALAHGLVLAAIAYAYGSISGAHVNPAVTFAAALRGRINWQDAVIYWVSQFVGAVLGAGALWLAFGAGSSLGATVPAAGVTAMQAVVVEAVLTFLLVNTVLHTAERKSGTPFAGVAIGFALASAILMGGSLTGASLNPARTFGPALFTGHMDVMWIYLLGPAAGAGLAALLYRVLK